MEQNLRERSATETIQEYLEYLKTHRREFEQQIEQRALEYAERQRLQLIREQQEMLEREERYRLEEEAFRAELERIAVEHQHQQQDIAQQIYDLQFAPLVEKSTDEELQLVVKSSEQWYSFNTDLIPVYPRYYLGISLVFEKVGLADIMTDEQIDLKIASGTDRRIIRKSYQIDREGLFVPIDLAIEKLKSNDDADIVPDTHYHEGSSDKFTILAVVITIRYIIPEVQDIGMVGRYKLENCVIAAIEHVLMLKTIKSTTSKLDKCTTSTTIKQHPMIKKLYAKYPQFMVKDAPVYLHGDELEQVARFLQIKLCMYTILGRDTGEVWQTFGKTRGTRINILVNSNHGTLIAKYDSPTQISYHDSLEEYQDHPLVSFRVCDPDGRHDLVMVENHIHKIYKPSQLTLSQLDDQDLKYAFVLSPEALFFKRIAEKFDIRPTKPEYKQLTKRAELFINRRKFQEPPERVTVYDHNKSFIAYKQCKYYRGFPTAYALNVDATTTSTLPTAFYVIDTTNVKWHDHRMETAFNMLYQSIQHTQVLPAPLYDFISNYATIQVTDRILSTFVDFDIEAEIPQTLPIKDRKRIYTRSIGMFIKGGMKEERTTVVGMPSRNERLQLTRECILNDIQYSESPNSFTMYRDKPSKGSFHVHSYILAYSGIQVTQKLYELLQTEKIVAVNVDGILTVPHAKQVLTSKPIDGWTVETMPLEIVPDEKAIGGWSVELIQTKTCYFKQSITKDKPVPTPLVLTSPHYDDVSLFNLTIAAAGIGKTAHHTMQPHIGQTNLFYTRALKNETASLTKTPCLTTQRFHKSFISTENEKSRQAVRRSIQKPAVIFEDETFQQAKSQWDRVITDAKVDQSFVFTAGDPCQIRQSINSAPVDIEYFRSRNFTIRYLDRTELLINTRHQFDYGNYLDSYRDLSKEDQADSLLCAPFKTISLQDLTMDDQIIVGTHASAKIFNIYLKSRNPTTIRCKHNTTKETKLLDTTDARIFWNKTHATVQLEQGTSYVPCQATTVDTIQGITVEGRVVVHVPSLQRRAGALYTAITRARTPENTVLIYTAEY